MGRSVRSGSRRSVDACNSGGLCPWKCVGSRCGQRVGLHVGLHVPAPSLDQPYGPELRGRQHDLQRGAAHRHAVAGRHEVDEQLPAHLDRLQRTSWLTPSGAATAQPGLRVPVCAAGIFAYVASQENWVGFCSAGLESVLARGEEPEQEGESVNIRSAVGAFLLASSIAVGGVAVDAGAAPSVVYAPSVIAAPSVLAGQFCKASDVGKVVIADNGERVKCMNDRGHNRWVIK